MSDQACKKEEQAELAGRQQALALFCQVTQQKELPQVTAGLAALLSRIGSPLPVSFAVMVANANKRPEEIQKALARKIEASTEALVESVFCFVKPPAELRALLDKGRAEFREAAMDMLADHLSLFEIGRMYETCVEHYVLSQITSLQDKEPK